MLLNSNVTSFRDYVFLLFDVLILVDDVMAGPIWGLKFLDPWAVQPGLCQVLLKTSDRFSYNAAHMRMFNSLMLLNAFTPCQFVFTLHVLSLFLVHRQSSVGSMQ